MKHNIPAVILSGGSEIVSLSLAEALVPNDVPLVVISLGKPSLIRNIQPGMIHRQLDWPPVSLESAISQLVVILQQIDAGDPIPWPIFTTEDGGLRLLLEGRNQLARYLAIPNSVLKMGGLDKAETFEYLSKTNLNNLIASSLTLHDPSQIPEALDQLGNDAIFKPALKPLSMDLETIGSKVITLKAEENDQALIKRLSSAWDVSNKWVAQNRLDPENKGEANWWGIRSKRGEVFGMTACEVWRQPRSEGTSCWVKSKQIPELHVYIKSILSELDIHGIVEISFLQDNYKHWCMIEINPRPWLQVALATHSGCPLIYATYLDQLEQPLPKILPIYTSKSWVNIERMILAALSGKYGPRYKALIKALITIYRSDCKIVYDTPFHGICTRWLILMLRRISDNITSILTLHRTCD